MYTAVILDVSAGEECCVVAYKASQNDLYSGLMVCNSLGAALDGEAMFFFNNAPFTN